jgi:hypothetical protein
MVSNPGKGWPQPVRAKSPGFSREYVLRLTARNMLDAIDLSSRKTTERIEEFSNDHERSQEILMTLLSLRTMRKHVEQLMSADK